MNLIVKSLWAKFLVLLVTVLVVALSATFFLREFMVEDFKMFLEQETQDRIYWLTASLEGSFERHLEWKDNEISKRLSWAAMMGMEVDLFDLDDQPRMNTAIAVAQLPFYVQKRVSDFISGHGATGAPVSYPLTVGGAHIGRLEVRLITPGRETQYIRRTNQFLVVSIVGLGCVALILSLVFSRRLTQPIHELTEASSALAGGDLTKRVTVSSEDELGGLAASFNRMAAGLALQDELRKKLTANVAHELRTPLTAMRAELEGMIDGLIPPEKENLRSMYAEIGRLGTVLNGMEDLAQAEASGLTLSPETLELGPFISGMSERFTKLFNDKGVALTLDIKGQPKAKADPERLSQVLVNLLSNALKATAPGGKVTINASQGASESNISVMDTGEGIPEAHLPYIFERFYRVSTGGLGIGLTIVRELVEAHGGTIEAKSQSGRGSELIVRLPS